MIAKKRPDLDALVLKLIAEKTKISVHDVALASGLSRSDEARHGTSPQPTRLRYLALSSWK